MQGGVSYELKDAKSSNVVDDDVGGIAITSDCFSSSMMRKSHTVHYL